MWEGPTKEKNVAHIYFILACKEGSGILTSFLFVFITSNISLLQMQVSAMNYTLIDAYIQRGLDLHSVVTQCFNFIQRKLSLVNAYIV